MATVTCKCGRPIAEALDPHAKVQGTCSACLPDPVAMLRFSLVLQQARRLSRQKVAYCAARVGVTERNWLRWERGAKLAPPYSRRDKLLSLFANTPAAQVILEEVQGWPS